MSKKATFLFEGLPVDIPGFTIVSHIGKGANAHVFLGTDNLLGRKVAIKLWRRKSSTTSTKALEETRKLAAVQHPNFAQVYRFGTESGLPFAVMEFVDGVTLKDWLVRGTAHLNRVAIWSQFSSAMKHIYSTGVLHGDPHTGNIMLSMGPLGHPVPPLLRSYVPLPESYTKVTILDTGTSRLWRSHRDFVMREKAVMTETVDRLFGRHCLSKAVTVPAESTLDEIVLIGDLLAIVFAASCAGPPQGSENMFNAREEMEYVATLVPSYMRDSIQLSYLRDCGMITNVPKLKLHEN